MKTILVLLISTLLVPAYAETDLDQVFKYGEVSRKSISNHHKVPCEINIRRDDFWGDGKLITDLIVWFERPEGHQGSASSLTGRLFNVKDHDLVRILSSKNSFTMYDYRDNKIVVRVNGHHRRITVTPRFPDKFFHEINSTFYYKIDLFKGRVVETEKKHWQKTRYFGRKELSFADRCRF